MNACPDVLMLVYAAASGEPGALAEHVPGCTRCEPLVHDMQAEMARLYRDGYAGDCDQAELVLGDIDEGIHEPAQLAALAVHARNCSLCCAQLVPLEDEPRPRRPTEPEDTFVPRGTERFEIKRRLGAGGMGVVYEAYDRARNVFVALKTLRDLSPQAIFRLKNEFRARQDLRHPNLVTLGELIEHGGHWFFTMELVHGVDFLRYVRTAYHGTDEREDTAQWQTDVTVDLPQRGSRHALPAETVSTPAQPMLPVNSGAGFDEARLRSALRQLCLALRALHDAGKVHRDIKPSNILVTDDGRLVLLDFGLIVEVEPEHAQDTAGTPAYMAPEQAAGKSVGPPADLYSVGVLLYQALTGRRPFSEDELDLLLKRRTTTPPPPRAEVPSVPRDLDTLCMELLAMDPNERPTVVDVLARLHGTRATSAGWDSASQSGTNNLQLCVGREHELAALDRALGEVRAGDAVTMLVHGEPGIGKSTLLQHARARLRKSGQDVVVLTGRCYERETVPFKAFDKVVDALSRYLADVEPAEAARLMPRGAHVLARMFPVLGRIPSIAAATDEAGGGELRDRVLKALRELLGNLSRTVPVVVLIDDLHWADADSMALIEAILRPPGAPRLLLVATARDAASTRIGELAERIPGHVHRLPLGRLAPDAAVGLASMLLGQHALEFPPSAAALAREAGGHPLFIQELVRGAAVGETTGARFESTLWSRIEALESSARRLLEMTVVACAPMPEGTLGRAAGIDASTLPRHIDDLRAANLVRAASAPGWLEPYHERVTSTVLAHLGEQALRSCHERLAWALEAAAVESQGERPELEPLAVHWHGAGDDARASRYAAKAAAQALRARSYADAARLFRMAVELAPPGTAALFDKLGQALSAAGRAREAADAFEQAARLGSESEALGYRLDAAHSLLAAGAAGPAVDVLAQVLADAGLSVSGSRSMLSRVAHRARIGIGAMRARLDSDIAPEELLRLDAAWSACLALAAADPARAADAAEQHVIAALEAGEPGRAARALGLHAADRALRGKLGRGTASLLDRAERAADEAGSDEARVLVVALRAFVHLCQGRWAAAHELAAGTALRASTGPARAIADLCLVRALVQLGRLGELGRLVPRLTREADDRPGRFWYLRGHLRAGLCSLVWLAADDVYTARSARENAMRRLSGAGVAIQHVEDLVARHHIDSYAGDARRAFDDLDAAWPALERSGFLDHALIRIDCLAARARSALAAARDRDDDLVQLCVRETARLAADKLPHAAPLAALLRAGVAVLLGNHDRAARHLTEADIAFGQAGMGLHAAVARRGLGVLTGGDRGHELRAEADAWMRSHGVVSPARMSALLAPGIRRE